MSEWQPARINLIHAYATPEQKQRAKERIVRIRPTETVTVGLPMCDAEKFFNVHPEDARFIAGPDFDFMPVSVCEHEILTD